MQEMANIDGKISRCTKSCRAASGVEPEMSDMELVRTIRLLGQNLGLVKNQIVNQPNKLAKAKKPLRFP